MDAIGIDGSRGPREGARRAPRVAHVCLRYPPATGGVERYVRDLAEAERARGGDVAVAASRLRLHDPPEPLPAGALGGDPPWVTRLPHAPTPGIAYPRLRGLSAWLDRQRPEVVHAHSFWYPPADVASRWARRRGVPFLLHPHYSEARKRGRPVWRLYRRWIGETTFRLADAVIAVSPPERERMERAGWPARRFVLLPPGVDLARFEKPGPDPFRARGLDGTVLLAVGRIDRGKRLAAAVEALPAVLARVPDARLAIVGEDFGERSALARRAAQLGVGERVHWLGFLPDDELVAAYRAAAVLVHPSGWEAFGIVLAESLAAGTPVVARRVGGVPWVAPDGECGLLFDRDDELASRVLRVLEDGGLAARLGGAGRERVRTRFGRERQLEALDGLRAELIEARRSGRR